MPEFRFYDITGDDTHQAIGAEMFSPEELQIWAKGLIADVPEGYQLTVRKRKAPSGRPELLIGCVKIGSVLLLKGEEIGADKPNAPAPPKTLDLPDVVKAIAGKPDEEPRLDIMAAKAGINTADQGWKAKSIPAKRAAVAKGMRVVNAV